MDLSQALRSVQEHLAQGDAATITWFAALLTAVARVAWALATALLKAAQRWWDRPIQWRLIELKVEGDLPRIKGHHCLIVRHASEDYVPALVSESERWEARLLNKSIGIVRLPSGRKCFRGFMLLPVHRRLGTQFKCYFDFKDETAANAFRALVNVPAEEQVKRGGKYHRVWVLLHDFEVTKVRALSDADRKFENNFIYPF